MHVFLVNSRKYDPHTGLKWFAFFAYMCSYVSTGCKFGQFVPLDDAD